jgi:predicted RND superfamily exporter protein
MTSLTSAIALASFGFAGADALWGLAIWGPIAVFCGFAAVCVLFPLLSRLLIRDGMARPAGFSAVLRPANRGLRHPRAMVVLTVLVTLVLLPAFNRAEPAFSFSEHIRDTSPLGQDMAFLEAEGLGSASLFVVIDDTDGLPGLSEADGPRLAEAAQAALGGVGAPSEGAVPQVPERFRAADGLAVALPVLLPLSVTPDVFGTELEALRAALEAAGLSDTTELAGQSLLAHDVVPATVSAMRVSFYIALGAIALVVAVSQRSLVLSLLATGISALPMLAIEGALVLSGQGMTMTAAFALTVAFGIAVDDTIHYINRWQLAKGGRDARLADAMRHAGPPMVATTLLMTLGFGATIFSATASLPQFGMYVMLALWMALIADLLFLPALIRLGRR